MAKKTQKNNKKLIAIILIICAPAIIFVGGALVLGFQLIGAFNTTFGEPEFYEKSDNPKVEQIVEQYCSEHPEDCAKNRNKQGLQMLVRCAVEKNSDLEFEVVRYLDWRTAIANPSFYINAVAKDGTKFYVNFDGGDRHTECESTYDKKRAANE